jgi:hypothetical protein
MEFGTGVLYKKLYSRYQFCEKQLSDIHTLLMGIKKLLPVLSIFLDQDRKSPCNVFDQLRSFVNISEVKATFYVQA